VMGELGVCEDIVVAALLGGNIRREAKGVEVVEGGAEAFVGVIVVVVLIPLAMAGVGKVEEAEVDTGESVVDIGGDPGVVVVGLVVCRVEGVVETGVEVRSEVGAGALGKEGSVETILGVVRVAVDGVI
jgi:hypothetical protein